MILGRYGPAGVLINEAFEILQFRGRTSPYLEAAPGAASFHILKMAREGLLVELRSSIVKARRAGRPIRKERLRVRQDGHFRAVNLEVVPMKGDGPGGYHFLVLFEDADEKQKGERRPAPEKKSKRGGRANHESIVQLEQELTATKDYLQSIIEEHEASNEELKSANEEILSSNEELQSTNEELETAKEELQSTNEELTTVNEELQNRNVELSQLNNDLQNILTGTNVAIVMLGPEGRLRRYTPQAETLLNLIPSDVGRPIRDIKPNVMVGDLSEIAREVIQTVSSYEREVQDANGHWYVLRARPYLTMEGRVEGAVLAFFDIDLLKRSLEQVNRAREYAEALVETVREALIVLDESLHVRTANQAFYRTFETSPGQTEGRAFLTLWGLDALQPELRALLERTARDNTPIQDYALAVKVDPVGQKTLRVNARRFRLPGEPQPLILVALEDFTDRTRAEEALRSSEVRYRRIFETAREGIWLMEAQSGQLLDVNPFLEELLGYSRAEMLGKRPWDLGIYDDPAAARSRFEANLAGGFGFEQEVMLRTKSGQAVFVEAITNTYDLGARRVTQANLRDVTERARLQEQVRQMQKLDSIGRLAGGVAHDFNNLLNIISAHVDVLAREPLAAEKREESAVSIQKAVERGSAVVRQLLTFARKTEIAFEPTDVNTVVREVASMLRETFPKQIRVSTKLAEDVPRIHADPNQLHQAVLNLAVNARDAMPQGGVLTLGTDVVTGETLRNKFAEAAGEEYVEVCVADTGVGMDAETRRRIFEPFFTTKGAKGQGLGLAVVYGIVNSHRGYVDVESEIGKGSTFRIYTEVSNGHPGAPDPSAARRRRSSRRNTTPPRAAPEGRATILVVEDEPHSAEPHSRLPPRRGLRRPDGARRCRGGQGS